MMIAISACTSFETNRTVAPLAVERASIAEMLLEDGRFTQFLQASQTEQLQAALSGDGPFTVFAPLDGAKAWPDPIIAAHHVATGRLTWADISGIEARLFMMDGGFVPMSGDAALEIGGEAQVVQVDIQAANGIIHIIDMPFAP